MVQYCYVLHIILCYHCHRTQEIESASDAQAPAYGGCLAFTAFVVI